MAKIETVKTTVILKDPNPSGIGFNIQPGNVQLKIKNDLVEHIAHLTPQEALQIGVTLIQIATQAQMLLTQNRVQPINGIPLPNMRG